MKPDVIGRRRLLRLVGGTGAAAILAGDRRTLDAATACVPATPQVTEGPYWIDEKLFRSDIRTDPASGVARPGVPLTLSIHLQNMTGRSCTPLGGAYVDVWHCDATGLYSDEPAFDPDGGEGMVTTRGQKFLRGYQISDGRGQVQFTTIYPGWYSGRTIHIHLRVRTYSSSAVLTDFVTQIFFDDAISNALLSQRPYNTRTFSRDTTNSDDMVYLDADNPRRMLATVTQSDSGYAAAITVGLSAQTAP